MHECSYSKKIAKWLDNTGAKKRKASREAKQLIIEGVLVYFDDLNGHTVSSQ